MSAPAAKSVNAAICLPHVQWASRMPPRKGGSALIQVARSRATELSLRHAYRRRTGYNLIDNDVGVIYNKVNYGTRHGHILELMTQYRTS